MDAKSEEGRSGWCPVCGTTVGLSDVAAAARRAGVEAAVIYEWIESGNLHVGETADGFVGVCVESVRAALEGT